MIDCIKNAKLNDLIKLDYALIKDVKFTFDKELGYSWIAHSNQHYHDIYPIVSRWNVKFFKTLNGSKKNFVEKYNK